MAFDLSAISKTKNDRPVFAILYGTSGVGKTTVASQADKVVFLPTEDGAGSLTLDAFPVAQNYEDVLQAIGALYGDHKFKTLALDSLDHLEPLIWKKVCADNNVKSIEQLTYGKGYVMALDLWRELLMALRGLRDQRKMSVLLIAHHQIRKHQDPELDQIDRYDIKLHSKASALVQESCDMVLFCKHKNITKKEDTGFGNSRTRGISTGKRVMCTTETPSYVAKNRFNLPDELDLSWSALAAALNPTPVTTQAKG
jgi:hypothetical protein